IKFLDDAAAQQHNEDLRPSSSSSHLPHPPPSPPQQHQPNTPFPSSPVPVDNRRWSGGSFGAPPPPAPLSPQFATEEGFEAVNPEDVPSGSVLASGITGTGI